MKIPAVLSLCLLVGCSLMMPVSTATSPLTEGFQPSSPPFPSPTIELSSTSSMFFAEPPPKQTVEAQETARVATAEAGRHAPKPNPGLPTATEPLWCPWPGPQATYVGAVGPDTGPVPFFAGEVHITSKAVLTLGGDYYTIWLGAPGDHPNQGLIRVLVQSADPCASHRLGTETPTTMTDYTTPRGPLTAIKVEGGILFYDIAGGGSGRLNFVTGQFLP